MYDAIIVGSGVGGSMAAHALVEAGWRVLMLERGDWVARGPQNREPKSTLELTPHFSRESAYRSLAGGYDRDVGSVFCVGGASVFFGGVAMRLREADFTPDPEIVRASRAQWPCSYQDLEPYYTRAEQLLGVGGDDREDPTSPPRSAGFPRPPAPLTRISRRFRDAARSLGLRPFPLPLAISFTARDGQGACDRCRTCDTFACALRAKNDAEAAVLHSLSGRGLEIRTGVVATGFDCEAGRITAVRAWDKNLGRPVSLRSRLVVLAAGALASPHLLLASELQRLNPAGHAVGRFLTRHCAAAVFGFCNFRPDPERLFHKELAVFDYYFGDTQTAGWRDRRIGCIQQLSTPAPELVKAYLPRFLSPVPLHGFVEHLTGALVIAEDEPLETNRVEIDGGDTDRFGLPRLCITHRYTRRDLQRRRMLVRRARRILRRFGAWSFHTHELKTFSHALGTVRMGTDPSTSPLDGACRFRGVENLLVVDGSTLPTSGAVNPSLTIAANALRAADLLISGAS